MISTQAMAVELLTTSGLKLTVSPRQSIIYVL